MRCFVAVCPDDEVRTGLDRLARGLHAQIPGARRLRADNLHLTLAFIGPLPAARAGALALALQSLPVEAIRWELNELGHFPRAAVIWAGGDCAPLSELAGHVRDFLSTQSVPYDRRAFAAHVSLLRDAPSLPPDGARALATPFAPIVWRIDAIHLMASQTDAHGSVRYRPLARP